MTKLKLLKKCRQFGCRYRATVKVRQHNGFIGFCCRRHIEGDEVIDEC